MKLTARPTGIAAPSAMIFPPGQVAAFRGLVVGRYQRRDGKPQRRRHPPDQEAAEVLVGQAVPESLQEFGQFRGRGVDGVGGAGVLDQRVQQASHQPNAGRPEVKVRIDVVPVGGAAVFDGTKNDPPHE